MKLGKMVVSYLDFKYVCNKIKLITTQQNW